MFGKKVPDNPPTTSSADDSSSKKNKAANKDLSTPAPLKPLSRKGSNGSSKPVVSTKSNVRQPSRSLPEIGRKFGGRDHTTVMHAVRKIEELKVIDSMFNDDVELLKKMLEN